MWLSENVKRQGHFEWKGDFIIAKIFKILRWMNEKQKKVIKVLVSKVVYNCVREDYFIRLLYKVKINLYNFTTY